MEYRRLGRSGLQVSVLSFGSWVSFGPQLEGDTAQECLQAAYDGGVNFFDNAESYAGGQSETIMGQAIAELGWPRHSYAISTKVFWGLHGGGGNFGVATSFTFRVHRVGPEVLAGLLLWPGDSGFSVGRAYRDFAFNAPDELGSGRVPRRSPPMPSLASRPRWIDSWTTRWSRTMPSMPR